MSGSTNAELEQFRQQWQAEVSSRQQASSETSKAEATEDLGDVGLPRGPAGAPVWLSAAPAREGYHEGGVVAGSYDFDDLEARNEARRLGTSGTRRHPESFWEPQTALEHFEKAIEKEGQGNMQESLVHYRKAYKLDDQVERAYRNKHFPANKFPSKPTKVNPSNASTTVPNTAHHSLHGGGTSLPESIALFVDCHIQPKVPDVEGAPQPPCPISSVPHEILATILEEAALLDVASFMRLSLVCKRFAYLTRIDDAIWRSVCWYSRFGFRDMHYSFSLTTSWRPLPRILGDSLSEAMEDLTISCKDERLPLPDSLPSLTSTCPTYLLNYQSRPRIRFSGVYISTVNYVRAGMSNANSVYWGNSPVHMVTYYRYLRFFRDGSAISLLTFFEPHDVVPLLTKENLVNARKHSREPLPAGLASAAVAASNTLQGQTPMVQPPTAMAVMREARRARWRLSPLHSATAESKEGSLEPEGNVYVETEGPTRNYTYHMQLALRSPRMTGVAKNTKLAWRSLWSYNHTTDDWAEFTLKNDKAFVYSRVKSWVDA